jgi:hypothetical protein
MACFPQLKTGSVVQWPLERLSSEGTFGAASAGGRRWMSSRTAGKWREWRLQWTSLRPEEAAALEAFHEEMQGELGEFTFFDPLENLLRESENLVGAGWSRGAGLTIAALGQEPGRGVSWAITNGGGANAELWQSIACDAGYVFCVSAELREATAGRVELFCGETTESVEPAGSWARQSATDGGAGTVRRMGIRLAPGGRVEIREPQAEAQSAPSHYKKSSAEGGVHRRASLVGESLRMVATGPETYATEMVIRSAGTE